MAPLGRRIDGEAGDRAVGEVPFALSYLAPDAHRAAARVMASGRLEAGPECSGFESELCGLVGASSAVAASSGSAALELALRSLRPAPGTSVLVSAVTAPCVAQAVLHADLRPVLVDVDAATGLPTVDTVAAAAARARTPSAMVVGHWAGAPADVATLTEAAGLCRDRVVEDALHALGAHNGARPVGAGGTVCFDFHATANLPVGQGGMVTTDDADRAAWMRRARRLGVISGVGAAGAATGRSYDVDEPALEVELDDLHAAIGRAQLAHFPRWQLRRRQLAARYDAALAGIPGIAVPDRPTAPGSRRSWLLYPMRLLPASGIGRDQLNATLHAAGVGTSTHGTPLHRLRYYRDACEIPRGGLPGAEAFHQQVVCLPLHPRLSDLQIDHVCAAVLASMALFGGSGRARPPR